MIKELSRSEGSVLGFEVSGKVSLEQEKEWIAKIENAIQQHDKLNVLVVLDEGASWGVKAGVEDLKWVLSHIKNLNKVAIVSSSTIWKWLVSIDGLFAQMVGIGEKHFDTSEIEAAWVWVESPDGPA